MQAYFIFKRERSDSDGRELDWGEEGLLVRDSPGSLCCVLDRDTLSAV